MFGYDSWLVYSGVAKKHLFDYPKTMLGLVLKNILVEVYCKSGNGIVGLATVSFIRNSMK